MKKIIVILMILSAKMTVAQDYISCSSFADIGLNEKATNCFQILESKYISDPSFYFYYLRSQVNFRNAQSSEVLIQKMNTIFPDAFFTISAQVIYLVSIGEINKAKDIYQNTFDSEIRVNENIMVLTVGSFITFNKKDPEYVNQWIHKLEKGNKYPVAPIQLLKGDYFASLGDYGNALNCYNLALDIEPKNSLAFYKKALAYVGIRNTNAALTELYSALQLTPEFPLALLNKAEIELVTGKITEGKKTFEKYFTLMPNNVKVHLKMGSCLFTAKEYSDAEMEANKVLQSDSADVSAIKLKAYSCYEQGKFEEGLLLLQKYFLTADTSFYQTLDYEYLGRFYQKTGQDTAAISAYTTATKFSDCKQETFSELGILLLKTKMYKETIINYEFKFTRFFGTSADYYSIGRAKLYSENFIGADSAFAKVCNLQPSWPNGFLMRANANAHMDPASTQAKAKPYYEKYIELVLADSANSTKYKTALIESYKYMGYYYFLQKDIQTSKSFWDKVILLNPNDEQAIEVRKQLK